MISQIVLFCSLNRNFATKLMYFYTYFVCTLDSEPISFIEMWALVNKRGENADYLMKLQKLTQEICRCAKPKNFKAIYNALAEWRWRKGACPGTERLLAAFRKYDMDTDLLELQGIVHNYVVVNNYYTVPLLIFIILYCIYVT